MRDRAARNPVPGLTRDLPSPPQPRRQLSPQHEVPGQARDGRS
jgi:hypothetical protein